jgi:hypothetical protein
MLSEVTIRIHVRSRAISIASLLTLLILGASLFPVLPARAANGSFTWAKSMGGTLGDWGTHIEVDAAGNLYTTGYFDGTADFDPGPGVYDLTSAGGYDSFVSKLDSSGAFLWARRMGGAGYDRGSALAVDANGNVYTTGVFEGTADFDPGPGLATLTSAGVEDIFVSKLDRDGNFVWARAMGGTLDESPTHIEVDTAGNVYTTGNFQGTADFDPGTSTYALTGGMRYDIFISKLDWDGDFLWARSMGGVEYDLSQSLALDASSNVYTTGLFWGTADFDPGAGTHTLTSAGLTDIFVSKLDSNGDFLWARSMGGSDSEVSESLALDASGNLYTTGYFLGTADFDPGAGIYGLTSAGRLDIFVSKLDRDGDFIWARGMGGADYDSGLALAVDASGNVYTTGSFQGAADFDPGAGTHTLTGAGGDDLFVSRLGRDGNFVWAKSMGGANTDRGLGLAVDAIGNVYATGYFLGAADFNPSLGTADLTSAGADDIFIVKLQEAAIFADVPLGYWALDFIERLYTAGITGGCATNPLRYCPEDTVTRAQMAVFLLRGIHGASYTPPAVGAGTGFGQAVTRAQMAVFLLRSKYGASYTPPAVGSSTGFGDVPTDYWAAAFIKQLVTEGITVGCGGGDYCPEQPVTRAQMAVFLVRTFSLP